jgi:hypothetical protein
VGQPERGYPHVRVLPVPRSFFRNLGWQNGAMASRPDADVLRLSEKAKDWNFEKTCQA